eukprot:CAMPEP_0174290126 /NCGR_PEP_ID=MMETSP0809-20121228/27703_1 /TAXON_ID=73025 ORGANISM="Eutreptiella gymnastica-like, Strain CCMP1594" /NCGR_SAMPLE_ID=MMETSP0809 /ASSEMBLY_ACC=CAM_ASM_000658 /LENGTH=51 /DNA_ID=CAMNT_0015388569 /DNA_START=535 /DNA_END=690 /DNA_ORIENTATION=+
MPQPGRTQLLFFCTKGAGDTAAEAASSQRPLGSSTGFFQKHRDSSAAAASV